MVMKHGREALSFICQQRQAAKNARRRRQEVCWLLMGKLEWSRAQFERPHVVVAGLLVSNRLQLAGLMDEMRHFELERRAVRLR